MSRCMMDDTQAGAAGKVVAAILRERMVQHESYGEQNLPDGTGHAYAKHACEGAHEDYENAVRLGQLTFAHILAEEFWEVMAEADEVKLEAELIQLGAVCSQWVEAIRRRTSETSQT
jgi:hypothetical protein